MNTRGELAGCGPAHLPPETGRQAGDSQSQKARGNLSPRDGILYQIVSRLPVANQVFLRSWMVDICQEGCSQRPAPQRTHMTYLRWHFCCAPRKLSSWNGGGDKMRRPTWGVCAHHAPGHLSCLTWEGHKTQAQPSLCLCGVPKNLNLSSLDLGSTHNPRAHLREFP